MDNAVRLFYMLAFKCGTFLMRTISKALLNAIK